MSTDDAPTDDAALAEKLVQGGTEQRRLLPEDLEESTQFGGLTPTAKVEVYTRRLLKQIEGERNRLLTDKCSQDTEVSRLRVVERELISLKSCLVRDRWETVVAICAMALGGSLLEAGPTWKPAGWAIIAIGGLWQCGKTLWVTVVDLYSKER